MRLESGLALIFVLCAFLRFWHLDAYGLWSDEFVTLLLVSADSYRELIKACFEVPQPMPPLYFLLSKFVFDCFPPGEASLRLLSALSSSLTGGLLFLLGRRLFDAETGLWAALLFAVNSNQIVYAQNARPYALCMMLSAASLLFFLNWLRESAWPARLGYVVATTLLFYAHYIFFPLVLIQNLYFLWSLLRRSSQPAALGRWKEWLLLQGAVAVGLLPLVSQLWHIVQARNSLNWESKAPQTAGDFLVFWSPTPLGRGLTAWLLLSLAAFFWGHFRKEPRDHSNQAGTRIDNFVLLGLWYLVPMILFFSLLRAANINLFVERYLTLASLATFLVVPAAMLAFGRIWAGRGALWIYCLSYIWLAPASFFLSKGQFSQGVPGGNEWRETLTQLGHASFQADLFLFQSPFIESNRLDFAHSPKLREYLSAPLSSFYLKEPHRPFVLLPVHWWIPTPDHVRFKAEIRSLLTDTNELVLLSTQEFWDHFEPWLHREFSGECRWRVVRRFQSLGALRLQRISRIQAEGSPHRFGSRVPLVGKEFPAEHHSDDPKRR